MADPISAGLQAVGSIASAIGSTSSAIGGIVSSGNDLKAAQATAAAQKYIAGQMTEQEYLKYMASLDDNLSGTVDNILNANQKTDYLPWIIAGGIFLVIIVIASKKSISI